METISMTDLVYLYYGASEYLLRKEINKLLQKLELDEFNVVKYDLLESRFSDVIEELQTISFFSGQRVVLVSGILELYNLDEYQQNKFINYLEKPNPETILIMYTSQIKDGDEALTKAFNLYTKLIKVSELKTEDLPEVIKKAFSDDDYQIDPKAITELIERTNADYPAIEQEINKLKLYAYDNKHITVQAIRSLVSKNLDDNIFELSSAIIQREQTKAIQIYYDLLVANVQPIRIIADIANQVRLLIHANLLLKRNYTQDMIAKHFGFSSGRAYYLVRDAKSIELSKLERYLEQLADLDFDSKSGKIDPRLGFELFILGV